MTSLLLDALLTTRPQQRVHLLHALLAQALMAAGVAAMYYFVWTGDAPARAVGWWTLATVAALCVAYALIRSGWSARLADPSLTVPQMAAAIVSAAAAYALVGAGRGGVFPILMVVLMFGVFVATPRQMARLTLFAVLLFGAVMALLAWRRPAVYVPRIEVGHFIMVATMVPAVSVLAARLARMRRRARQQRVELQAALARIRELATRDELTGLFNRRHLTELMEQEHQRCIRSGHTFCIAALEIDAFAQAVGRLGAGGGELLLRGVAQESLRLLRAADVLGCWGGHRFVLLMSDTRAPLGRGALERLRDRVTAALAPSRHVTLSAGLAEHHAGETVEQTLARAEAALADAATQGSNRVAVA